MDNVIDFELDTGIKSDDQLLETIGKIEKRFVQINVSGSVGRIVNWTLMRDQSQELFQHYINLRNQCRSRKILGQESKIVFGK